MKTLSIALILAAGLALSGCGVPMNVAVKGQYGTYAYSSKGGLTVTVEK